MSPVVGVVSGAAGTGHRLRRAADDWAARRAPSSLFANGGRFCLISLLRFSRVAGMCAASRKQTRTAEGIVGQYARLLCTAAWRAVRA